MDKLLKVYVAGRMIKHSHYDSHNWRDGFLRELNKLSDIEFISFDPTQPKKDYSDPEMVFASDVYMISQVDVLIVYLSDDISVGGSQEILIAKYFKKPVIGLAPRGGKFNASKVEVAGTLVENYRHPFVYTTCDVVCADIKEVAEALKKLSSIKPKGIDLIPELKTRFEKAHLKNKLFEERVIK